MAYIACPGCKKISCELQGAMLDRAARHQAEYGLTCKECFSERKIIMEDMPSTCKHGRAFNIKCKECEALTKMEDDLDG